MKTFILDLAIRWAGDRIICVGEYVRRGDLPQNFLSKEEEEELERDYDESDDDQDWQTHSDRLMTLCDHDISLSSTAYWPGNLLDKLTIYRFAIKQC
jgi:hypothetical protein